MNRTSRFLKPSRLIAALILLSVAGAVAVRLLQGNTLETRLRALEQEGYPVTLEAWDAYYPSVPAADNAALIFEEAFSEMVQPAGKDPDLPLIGPAAWPAPGEPFSEAMREAMRTHLRDNAIALEIAHRAARRPRSRYPINLQQGFNTLVPHLAKVKSLTQLLRLEAAHHALEGDADAAVRSIHTAFSAARSLAAEPLLISELVRIACVAITLPAVETAVNQLAFTDDQLRLLMEKIQQAGNDSVPGFRRAMAGERVGGIAVFRMNPGQTALLPDLAGGTGPPAPLMWLTRVSGLHARDFQIYLGTFDRILSAAALPPHQAQTEIDRHFAETDRELGGTLFGRLMVISRSILPALSGIYSKEIRLMASLRAANTALAIERYRLKHGGEMPASLQDLVPEFLPETPTDPTDNTPLRLEKLETGYRVIAAAASAGQSASSGAGRSTSPVAFTVAR